MKTVTGNLRETIEQERNRVAQQIKELTEQNVKDSSLLQSLKEEYSKAVFDTDTKLMDELNAQIKELAGIIQERKDMIEVLSDKKNPVIQRTVAEASKAWLGQLKQIDEEATNLFKELEQHHKKVVAGLEKLQLLREQADRLAGYINDYNHLIPIDSREALGLPKTSNHSLLSNIRKKYMDPLLINNYVKRQAW